MGQYFVPDCNHCAQRETCRFFCFLTDETKKREWIALIRRQDREPNKWSRVYSCHFVDGKKENYPEIFERNKDKLFAKDETPSKRQKVDAGAPSSTEVENNSLSAAPQPLQPLLRAEKLVMEMDLQHANERAEAATAQLTKRAIYSVDQVNEAVLRMETGLSTKGTFYVIVGFVRRFQPNINYYSGWKVDEDTVSLDNQIFITLMKLRQNYTNLHLAQLFACSESTISNIVLTFVSVLYKLFAESFMSECSSRQKNKLTAPSSFDKFPNCRMIIDCTDFEIAVPKAMDHQRATYSSYRSMNYFKCLIGVSVSPSGVITYVSKLYPGSISDRQIVEKCGILSLFMSGDLILADKGFLIKDLLPPGVTVNIPPCLSHQQLTESEVKIPKDIASCRIHVERANARLKAFKILSFIPHTLRDRADMIVKLVAALVNMQYPLIKDVPSEDAGVYFRMKIRS